MWRSSRISHHRTTLPQNTLSESEYIYHTRVPQNQARYASITLLTTFQTTMCRKLNFVFKIFRRFEACKIANIPIFSGVKVKK